MIARLLPVLLIFAMPLAAATRPNIVIIMADDMGFSDAGCYGGEIETPNLDRLAAEGMRFSQFYNCALCGPTRAALMTGLYPHQVGITTWTGLLNDRCVTLFELLNRSGYATCAVGRLDMITAEKWHDPANIAKHASHSFGSIGHTGPGHYFFPVRNSPFVSEGRIVDQPEGAYKTDYITDYAVEFIAERERDKPFLLYMGHYAPHWPLHAKPEDIAKYRERYRRLGWDEARAARLKRLRELGLVPTDMPLSPRDDRAPAWSEAAHQDWEAERMAVYAAQIDCLDQNIGRVLDALRAHDADRDTMVLFFSDNGASDKPVSNLDKPGNPWRLDGTPTRTGNKPDIQPGPADNFVTAGPAWACLANTPFRGHKQGSHEGGIASPFIAWWPEVICKGGGISSEVSHVVDVMATCLDIAGVAYPQTFDGRQVQPAAGLSLLPVFQGKERAAHDHLGWSVGGTKAVRQGNWKLVAAEKGPWELYDLKQDRNELRDVASEHPDRVADLARLFAEWREH